MDSKIVKDARLADLVLKTVEVCAKVSDIPGASIDTDNVVLDMSKFGEDAVALFAIDDLGEVIVDADGITNSAGSATLDFAQAQTVSKIIKVCVQLKL